MTSRKSSGHSKPSRQLRTASTGGGETARKAIRLELEALAEQPRPYGLTAEQKAVVREFYGRGAVTAKVLAERLECTLSQVRNFAQTEGLKRRGETCPTN